MTDGRMIKGNETKDKIIMVTLEMISEMGLKSLSAQKIASRAGVSKSNIFHHFGSVDKLPMAAMDHLKDMMLSHIERESTETLRDVLIKIGAGSLTCNEEESKIFRAFFHLYNESFHNDDYKMLLNDVRDQHTNLMLETIIDIEGDVFDKDDLEKLSKLITITIDGFGYHYMSDYKSKDYMDMWTIQVDMIINQLETYKKKY